MPFNGSGTFTLVAGNPVVTGTTISSTVQNNTTADFATGLTNCVTRDGQSAALANLPMGGYKHTGAVAASTTGEYLTYGQTSANLSSLTVGTFTTTGNVNVNGNVTIGDAPADTLTINPNTVFWPGNPTHSGAHTWSGVQTFSSDPSGRITSGKFTPTLTNTSNVSSSSVPGVSRWIRVGPMVFQTGIFTMTPTVINSTTVLGISLGVASDLGNSFDLNGGVSVIGQGGGIAPDTTHIFGDGANNRATVSWSGLTTSGLQTYRYWLMYEVL